MFDQNTGNMNKFYKEPNITEILLVCQIFNIYPASESLSGTSLFSLVPTARIQACGGLMIAEKFFTLYMPKLEMVNVPPYKKKVEHQLETPKHNRPNF
jgi:hypothetical protein